MKISKFNVINWGQINNSAICFDNGSVLLSGENGTGKTTMFDALLYFLSGSLPRTKDDDGGNTERTPIDYCLGITTDNSKSYRKPNQTVTYLQMEFTDGLFFKTFMLVLEPHDLKSFKSFYFEIDEEIDNIPFTDENNYFLGHLEIRNALQTKFPSWTNRYPSALTTMVFYKDLFSTMGITSETKWKQYRKLLPFNKMSKDIFKNLDIFFDTILDEPIELDYDKILDITNQVGQAEKRKENEISEKKLSSNVIKAHIAYTDAKSESNILESYQLATKYSMNKFLFEKYSFELRDVENTIIDKKSNIDLILESIGRRQDTLSDLNDELLDKGSQLSKYNNQEELALSKKEGFQKQERAYNIWKDNTHQCLTEDKKFSFYANEFNKCNSIDDFSKFASKFNKILEEMSTNSKIDFKEYKKNRETIKTDINSLSEEISQLKIGTGFLPTRDVPDILCFKNELGLKLSGKYDKSIIIPFLYENVSINNDDWRKVIESFLGIRRFALVIPQEYVKDAMYFYKDYKSLDKKHINLILPMKEVKQRQNSLSQYIDFSETSLTVKNYVNYHLNKSFCSTYDELVELAIKQELPDGALSLDGYLYSGRSFSQLSLVNNFVLGDKSLKKRLEVGLKEVAKLTKQRDEISEKIDNISSLLDLIVSLESYMRDEFNTNRLCWVNVSSNLTDIENELLEIRKNIKFAEANTTLLSLQEEINSLKIEIKNLENDKNAINKEITTLKDKEFDLLNRVNSIQNILVSLNFDVNHFMITEEEFYLSLEKIADEEQFNKKIIALNKKKTEFEKILEKLYGDFKDSLYALNRVFQEEGKVFREDDITEIQVLNDSLGNLLEQTKILLASLKESLSKVLLNYITENISGQIQDAKNKIQGLNDSLSKVDYGINERMKIISKNVYFDDKDKDQSIESTINYFVELNALNIVQDSLDPDYKKLIDLANNLLKTYEVNSKSLKERLNYKRYFSLDLIITSSSGDFSFKSKKGKVASNGEKKRRLVVLMAIAFIQCLDTRQKDASALVLIDEFTNDFSDDLAEKCRQWCCNCENLQFVICQQSSPYSTVPKRQYVFKTKVVNGLDYAVTLGRDLSED